MPSRKARFPGAAGCIVTITSWLLAYSLPLLVLLSFLTRGGRFFFIAVLPRYYGEPAIPSAAEAASAPVQWRFARYRREICRAPDAAAGAASSRGSPRCVTQRLRAPPGINAVERGGIVEESDDSHFWIDRAVFRKIADARLRFAALRFHVIAVDRDQARAGFKEPRQQFHDCGLAGPV